MTKSYEIAPRLPELGGGWNLRLLEDGEEMGGGYFLPIPDPHAAYIDLLDLALDWVEGQVERQRNVPNLLNG
jgi:hypothetical protein